ncbi:uncharacterized protein LOC119272974 [Triticum dicoccoides]|uniref:uncharacterized protein LOC119272974 n=1 Tax=Triticum dicoccoides TaxID=85692 RepID=UPI00188F1B60|nr:uncharacterized protein LOC119272974 [Triticum dicoccoides]
MTQGVSYVFSSQKQQPIFARTVPSRSQFGSSSSTTGSDLTGRDRGVLLCFLHKNLPQLADYHVVATTLAGYFVLAGKSPPHAACVLNPLTGIVIPFAAPVPPDVGIADVISPNGSSLRLAVFCDSSRKAYAADPHSKSFSGRSYKSAYHFIRKAAVGGVYAHMNVLGLSELREMFTCLHKFLPAAPFGEAFSGDLPSDAYGIRCSLVGLDGHICVVLKLLNPQQAPSLFALQLDTETGKLSPVKATGRFVIFIGDHKCFSVDADKFPGTEADCVYYIEHLGSSAHICKCYIKDNKRERILEAADFRKQDVDRQFVLVADRPYTIIHLLSSYAINTLDSQLALQQFHKAPADPHSIWGW